MDCKATVKMDINIIDIIINSVSIIPNWISKILLSYFHLNRNTVSTIELAHIANYRNIIETLLYINFTIISDIRSLSHDIPYANFKSYAFNATREEYFELFHQSERFGTISNLSKYDYFLLLPPYFLLSKSQLI